MCCFSRPVRHVAGTQIFARTLPEGRQALAYSMNLVIRERLAMVLPLPVVPGGGDGAVRFVALDGYAHMFKDLAAAFPPPPSRSGYSRMLAAAPESRPRLKVHGVGAFEASYVPSPDDFDRLDPRFRIDPTLFESHPEYRDWGFAVFQLAPRRWAWLPGRRSQTVHPMALTFPTREPGALYFPTVHLHDGTVPERARFDHHLYLQSDDPVLDATLAWARARPASRWIDIDKTRGLVDGDLALRHTALDGSLRNVDVWVRPPPCTRPLEASGRGWHWKVNASSAYLGELHREEPTPRAVTARTRLDDLVDAMAGGLSTLAEAHADDWHLTELTDELPRLNLSNDQVHRWTGGGPEPVPAGEATPCAIDIGAWSDTVDFQSVRFGFARVPGPDIVASARAAVTDLLASL